MVDTAGMSGHTELPEILLTSATGRVNVPSWVKAFPHETRAASELRHLERLPAMTIVQAESAESVLAHRALLSTLAKLHAHQSISRIVFSFLKAPHADMEATWKQYEKLLGHFVRAASIELARRPADVRPAFEEAFAKYLVEIRAAKRMPAPAPASIDPLGSVRSILDATDDLRAASGRLDAARVAEVFGLSVSELSGLLGKSRQAVSKTPDAESLQHLLRPYERAARLRAILSASDFRAWLNLANGRLDGATPIEVARAGRISVLADLTEDLLTGAPA